MKISSVTTFCKLPICPSAEVLLTFSNQRLDAAKYCSVLEHLGHCDFCCAELQMLANHSSEVDPECPTAEMPIHLKLLAESILFGQGAAQDGVSEKEPVSLTDVM
jgi:hypothetical protein